MNMNCEVKSSLEPHPHEFQGSVPDRLPTEVIRELSVLRRGKAIAAILVEWISIAAAIALCEALRHPVLYIFAVAWIGARQHALTVLGHDAAHFRLFSTRLWNERIGNMAVMWPVFLATEGYRYYHGEHHRFTGRPADGNRFIWGTHTAAGELTNEWTFPKTHTGLVMTVVRRAAFLTGLFWILRGFVGAVILRRSWGHLIFRVPITRS
jgi:fatty acid desaturase